MHTTKVTTRRGMLEFEVARKSSGSPAQLPSQRALDFEALSFEDLPSGFHGAGVRAEELALAKRWNVEHLFHAEEALLHNLSKLEPHAIIRFGSLARVMAQAPAVFWQPRDVDLIYIGNKDPRPTISQSHFTFGVDTPSAFDVWWYSPKHVSRMATLLSNVPPLVAGTAITLWSAATLSVKEQLLARHLIGPQYQRYWGLSNAEIAFRTDPCDYSVHQIHLGEEWWNQVRKPVEDMVTRKLK